MEDKDLQAEIHPLKSEEEKDPGKSKAKDAEKVGPFKTPGRLSRWRTAAFFLSLFLCLFVVFAFSFIVPCPLRPISQKTWNKTFDDAVAYQFLATRDMNGDKVRDVLFAFLPSSTGDNSTIDSLNRSCASEGFAFPCAILVALSGTDGKTLWQRPVGEELLALDCSVKSDESPGCLVVVRPDSVKVLDLCTGQNLWNQSTDFGANTTVLQPLLEVPDVDGDSVPEFLIFTAVDEEIKSWFFSGRHGVLLGSQGSMKVPGWKSHFLHLTRKGAYYVLFCTAGAVYVYSIKELYHTAIGMTSHRDLSLTEDPHWEETIDSVSHVLPIVSPGEILYLKRMPGRSGSHFVLARSLVLELLDGQLLGSIWAIDITDIFSEPAFGSFDRGTVDIVVETRIGPNKKKILIIESNSGLIYWKTDLLWAAGTPQVATLPTLDQRSVFLFWGVHQMDNNTKSLNTTQQFNFLYLFHPTFPNVLLEMTNILEPIVVFKAVLLERSRHACYLLLTGPQVGGVPGNVTVSKRRLKEDIAGSRVIWLDQEPEDTDQNVRNHFLRMRFRHLG